MALLAAFLGEKQEGESLEDFLDSRVFAGAKSSTIQPEPTDVAGFKAYTERYKKCLSVELAAVQHLNIGE